MFALRPDFDRALAAASQLSPGEAGDWLNRPPAGAHSLNRITDLPADKKVAECGQALLNWDLHRRSGLQVTADGPAAVGTTVVLGLRIGPTWMVAPCRVTALVSTAEHVEFIYATLPGHPEIGAERFAFIHDGQGLRFEVSAVSRHVFWGSRLVPALANRMQAQATDRYLAAAERIAGR